MTHPQYFAIFQIQIYIYSQMTSAMWVDYHLKLSGFWMIALGHAVIII